MLLATWAAVTASLIVGADTSKRQEFVRLLSVDAAYGTSDKHLPDFLKP